MTRPIALRAAAPALAIAVLAACGGENLMGPEDVDRVELDPSSATLSAVGATQRFTARPLSASGQAVSGVSFRWSTTDEAVATVDSTGTVTAAASGDTEVQVRVVGSPVTGSASVTVDQEVASFAVEPDSATLDALQATRVFRAEVLDPNGEPVTDADPTWTSTRDSVATVDGSGTAQSVANGVTEIVAALGERADTATLVVRQTVAEVRITPDSVQAGQGDTLDFRAEPVDASGIRVPDTPVSWSSTDSSVVDFAQTTDSTARASVVGSGVADVVAEAPNGTRGAAPVLAASNPLVRSVFLKPRGVLRDSTVELGAVVANSGTEDVQSLEWSIRREDGTELRSGTISSLAAGTSDSLPPQSGLGPFSQGTHRLTLELDPSDRITETNEDDNTATARLESYPAGYDIELKFVGSVSSALRSVGQSARDRWQRVITGDLPNVGVADSLDLDRCFQESTDAGKRGDPIDDLLLMIRSDSIDGGGGVLARAGPCFVRVSDTDPSAPPLPVVGAMVVDSADVDGTGGTLEEIVIHEIGHALGFGGLWNFQGGDGEGPYQLLEGSDTDDPTFTGAFAIDQFLAVGGDGFDGEPVPVANQGGEGTRNSHWRESVFGNELMTGFINPNSDNPLSVVSIASLADQFYAVDLGEADPFQLSTSSLVVGAASGRIRLGDHLLRVPPVGITPSGHLRPLSPPPR